MILLLDNHDSFVHNLARYLRRLGQPTEVIRSNAIDADQCLRMRPSAIVISPGPRRPEEAGCSVEVIQRLGHQIPMLGVCLGHQAIGHAYGASVIRCEGMHGRSSEIDHAGTDIFEGCRRPMRVGRYHSLAIDEATLPSTLIATAYTFAKNDDSQTDTLTPRVLMGVRHRDFPVYGVQFHPESVLSEAGADILANFVRIANRWNEVAGLQVMTSGRVAS